MLKSSVAAVRHFGIILSWQNPSEVVNLRACICSAESRMEAVWFSLVCERRTIWTQRFSPVRRHLESHSHHSKNCSAGHSAGCYGPSITRKKRITVTMFSKSHMFLQTVDRDSSETRSWSVEHVDGGRILCSLGKIWETQWSQNQNFLLFCDYYLLIRAVGEEVLFEMVTNGHQSADKVQHILLGRRLK